MQKCKFFYIVSFLFNYTFNKMYICFINIHKGIALMPQLLKACDPPIPFHCLKQCKGDYVITFPGAFHFVVNAGVNAAKATNFAILEWAPFAKKSRCMHVLTEEKEEQ